MFIHSGYEGPCTGGYLALNLVLRTEKKFWFKTKDWLRVTSSFINDSFDPRIRFITEKFDFCVPQRFVD